MANNTKIVFDVQANIEQIKKSANEISTAFENLKLPNTIQKSFSGTFNKLAAEIKNFEAAAGKGFDSLTDAKKGEQSIDNIITLFEKLKIEAKEIKGLPAEKLLPKESLNRLKEYQNLLKQAKNLSLKDNSKDIAKQNTQIQNLTKQYNQAVQALKNNERAITDNIAKYEETSNKIKETKAELTEYNAQYKILRDKGAGNRTAEEQTQFQSLSSKIAAATSSLTKYEKILKDCEDSDKKFAETGNTTQIQIDNLKSSLDEANAALQKIQNSSPITEQEFNKLKQSIKELSEIDVSTLPNNIQVLIQKIKELEAGEGSTDELKNSIVQIATALQEASQQSNNFKQNFTNNVVQAKVEQKQLNSEVEQLKTRLGYFFSLANGVQLFKRAIRDAYESITDLDAAMTEMAVVTNYNIGDLWKKMPEYSKNANELGMKTVDVYKSMVLYTQQGLDAAQAQELSNQTLRMARIAGMEATDATDAMTSALRGFNMELTEASGQRINDVYSNLAAHAAANTEEISDAMMRTASIAHGAGMEFENTAAFLTQMINHATLARVA